MTGEETKSISNEAEIGQPQIYQKSSTQTEEVMDES